MIDWNQEVLIRKAEIIKETQTFLQIESVLDEGTATENAPFGQGIRRAYDWLLQKAKNDGFTVKDLDGYAAHIEYGEGADIVGVLCHIDVVPGGDNWTTPAFSATIRDGSIFARGALDDKGPTISCYYALKIVKEAANKLGKRVRIIIGTDEESQWRCVDHYFKHEEMPLIGFAPDADFPIIYAEKGISNIEYSMKMHGKGKIHSFESGDRLNMVPDQANAKLDHLSTVEEQKLEQSFYEFVREHEVSGKFSKSKGCLDVIIEGVSAHGAEPEEGVNAGLYLACFLTKYVSLTEQEKRYLKTLKDYFFRDSQGAKLEVSFKNEELGDLTINVGRMSYFSGKNASIGINVRYPEGASYEVLKKIIDEKLGKEGLRFITHSHEEPHALNKTHELVQKLSKVYERQMDKKASLIAIGGGTYARSLDAGVAFGPLMPGEKDTAHQADECISIDNLLKMTAIYADAIYELAKKEEQ
ncbi:dipeptidase PepV [Salipaludibacillus neizhouensis]|uniref:Dipeptidase PepV n=1 Tax=Salipaludibacillus neizhouensis TaxID=885475 RepID=A0A3A9KGQ8_9BACI|nr:dipeptidase PepV [Salipaludibacillus neizhouensis]RKL66785.1 dipeptidase PepV [Salipaludibacillus neizhouensis]